MLLTLKQSAHPGFKSFHDYTPPTPPSTSRFSPALTNGGSPFPPFPPATKSTSKPMSTPHRGLPPPAAMTLPQPTQAPSQLGQSSALSQPMGQLPAPPQQWQGAEESMRNWLHAKAEEDKRKQEEEKTRQEGLRLEQRKLEHEMLRTSLNGGIPPYMIPMVFAGMGGANLANTSLEWTQHYMAAQAHQQQQLQQQLQQQQQQAVVPHPITSPELRRDSRQTSHLQGASQHPLPAPLPSTPISTLGSQQPAGFVPSYPLSPSRPRGSLPGPSALSRLPPSSDLPRINTAEMQIQQPPQGPPGVQGIPGQQSHPLQQSQSANPPQPESQPPSSIYFHHWQPPTTQAGTSGPNQPSTPSDVPSSSPKKRKAQGPQQAAPAPSQTQHTSPYSLGGSSTSATPSGRRRGHSRQRSDLSSRALDSYGRPSSRHRHSESVISTQSGASPTQLQGFEAAAAVGTPTGQTRSQRTSTSERSDTRQSLQEQSFSFGSEVRQEDRVPAEQDSSSSRTSGKREETRD